MFPTFLHLKLINLIQKLSQLLSISSFDLFPSNLMIWLCLLVTLCWNLWSFCFISSAHFTNVTGVVALGVGLRKHSPFIIVAVVQHPHDDAGPHGDEDEQEQSGKHCSDYQCRVAGGKRFLKKKKNTQDTTHEGFRTYPTAFKNHPLTAFKLSWHISNIRSKLLVSLHSAAPQNR